MKTFNVSLKNRSYTINVKMGLQTQLPEILSAYNKGQSWVLFTQQPIFDLYGSHLAESLRESEFKVHQIILENSEAAKSLSSMESIYSQLIAFGCDRSSSFLALGGGVVGDATGFAAATFLRGVDYFQIPTTLLAMVDSSIGGKTGINLDAGKNLVGAIWQPKSVLIDPTYLNSLPKREVISALGEVLKYGAVLDRNFFDLVSAKFDEILQMNNPELLDNIICICSELKAKVVVLDECEGGLRRILNFGHTIGHALEKYFGYGVLRHGEAVAYGMLAAGRLSLEYGGLKTEDYQYFQQSINKLPLPPLPEFDVNEIIEIMATDKKVKDGKINFVLLSKIGETKIVDSISKVKIIEVLKQI